MRSDDKSHGRFEHIADRSLSRAAAKFCMTKMEGMQAGIQFAQTKPCNLLHPHGAAWATLALACNRDHKGSSFVFNLTFLSCLRSGKKAQQPSLRHHVANFIFPLGLHCYLLPFFPPDSLVHRLIECAAFIVFAGGIAARFVLLPPTPIVWRE